MSEKKEWFESEDFWKNYGPIMFDEAHWQEAPAIADRVMKLAALHKGDSVLDAGCGVGRISVELAALGLRVTGTDIIQAELDTAAESARDEGVEIDFIKADMRKWCRPAAFDCAVNLYTSFGYCDTIEEDMLYLKKMCDCVRPGGTFIFEGTTREIAALYFTKGEEFDRAGYKVVTDFSVTGDWEGLRSHWTLYPADTDLAKNPSAAPLVDHTFIQRLYPATTLRDKILENGFKSAKVYGNWEGTPYDEHAATCVIVAKK